MPGVVKGLTKESSFQEAGPVVEMCCFETMLLFEDVFFGKKRGTPPSFFPVIGRDFFGGGGESLPEMVSTKLCVCLVDWKLV